MMRYKYRIKNLDCANCARKLEEGLNQEEKLNHVVVNFATSKISYETEQPMTLEEINDLAHKIEPECIIVEEHEVTKTKEYHLSFLVMGIIFVLFSLIVNVSFLKEIFMILAYVILLEKPFIHAVKMLVKSKTINENALIVISCIGAYFLSQKMEGVMVVSLYILGKILEEKAINNTREEVNSLLDMKQNYANLKRGNHIQKIDVEEIKVDDVLVIKKGEKIPVDGRVIKGTTTLDTSFLTGESEWREVGVSDLVLSGSINTGNVIEMKTTSVFRDSTVAIILSLVEEATDKKAKTETFVSKASKIYTPIIFALALLVFLLLPILPNVTFQDSLYRALTFLVISCPCAIAISVPLSYFTGIGVSSKNGILIKGSNYLDNLSHMDKIIFDKTGTLTTGSFRVTNIEILDNRYSKEQIINILRKGETNSNHPIAKSIMKLSEKVVDTTDVQNYQEIAGSGISFELNKQKIKIGNQKLCHCQNTTDIHLSIDGKHIASIGIDDGLKANAKEQIEAFKRMNIKTYMFTGDKEAVASSIGNRLGIDVVKSEMFPTDKYKEYEKICGDGEIVGFVGDGVNDAPVLKRASIGISMGSIGSNQAVEASDIVIMNDDLSKIPLAIQISKFTNHIIKQNLIFAITVKIVILLLSIVGISTMWFAVFADTGVTLITILNTLRIMKRYQNNI